MTEEGRRLARWDQSDDVRGSPNSSSDNVSAARTSEYPSVKTTLTDAHHTTADALIHRRISMTEKLSASYDAADKKQKESNTDRLQYIIEEPQLRPLFREFLKTNLCEENLSFYLDVQDLKHKFYLTSSAIAAGPIANPRTGSSKSTPAHAAMKQHLEALIQMAFVIYNTYLAPSSQSELTIDLGLRNELSGYLGDVITNMTGKVFQGRVEREQANAFNATQLQKMIQLYEQIQTYVFRLMATDSMPKVRAVPLGRYNAC